MDTKKNQQEFEALLRSTGREGIEYVIEDLEKDGFFEAPASSGHHLNIQGGLCQHSLNVCKAGLMIWEGLKTLDPSGVNNVKRESVIIATLLHDVCKTDIYKEQAGTVGRLRRLHGIIQRFSYGAWGEISHHVAL